MIQHARPIFLSAYLGMLLFGVSLITLGSVAPGLKEKFSLDAISFGTLSSILPFGIFSGSLLFGPFADKYGYKIIFILASLCILVGFQGIAFASSLTVLKISVFLFGLGGGAINGASNAVVSDVSEANKGANLSFLGVFFAIGALGMPFILGILEGRFPSSLIVATVGFLPALGVVLFLTTTFPVAKQIHGISLKDVGAMVTDGFLLLVGFFLFCQCSFEAIINNWTTSYLLQAIPVKINEALYALSIYVLSMAVMRIILGGALRTVSTKTMMFISIFLLVGGETLIELASTYTTVTLGLALVGAGLAAGFPVMLGFVGERYKAVSGTAFSLVISIALLGSTVVNYVMGLVTARYGIQHFTTIGFVLTAFMLLFLLGIFKKLQLS
jgi:MFS transporter, FHS family, glucose/mannose:H+ symporter